MRLVAAAAVLRIAPAANHALRTLTTAFRIGIVRARPTTRLFGKHSKSVCKGGVPPAEAEQAWQLASLPAVHGGLGLPSAERTAPAAYWAAWMDALPVIRSRLPGAADCCSGSGSKARRARFPTDVSSGSEKNLLQKRRPPACPGWHGAYEGARQAATTLRCRPGRMASRLAVSRGADSKPSLSGHYRDRVAVAGSAAILSGLATLTRRGTRVCAVPSEPALTLAPQAMQLALRRLRLPLPLSPNHCSPSPGCGHL